MSTQIVLTTRDRAILIFILWLLGPAVVWIGLGIPTDKAALSLFLVGELMGVGNFVNDLLTGNLSPPPVPKAA